MIKEKWFLPLNCLKSFILIGTILTILVGTLSTFMVMYAFLMSSLWLQFSRHLRNILILCFLLGSNLIILSGVAGLYGIGVVRKKNIFLSIYTVSILAYIVLFVVLGLFATIYPKQILQECNSSKALPISQAVEAANQTLCNTCACYFNNYQEYNNSQRQILRKLIPNSSQTDVSLPVNASNCADWENSTYPDTYQLFIMESFFSCSGWCPADPRYNLVFFFTNVNNGIPVDFCFNSMNKFFKRFGLMLRLSSFLVSGVLMVVLITMICLCYHPKRNRSGDKKFQANLIEEQT